MCVYGNLRRLYLDVVHLLNGTFQDRNLISKFTVIGTVQQFEEEENLKDHCRPGWSKTTTTDDVSLEVMHYFVKNPNVSVK